MRTSHKILATILSGAAVLLASCATLGPGDFPAPAELVEPETPRIEAAFDLYQLRLDINRTVPEENPTIAINKDGTHRSAAQASPYHFLGADIGNGLFVDFNGNLCVDLVRLAGLDRLDSFRLTRVSGGIPDGAAEYVKKGGSIFISDDPLGRKKIEIVTEDNTISVSTSKYFAPKELIRVKKEIRLHPSGFFSNFRQTYARDTGGVVIFSNGGRVEEWDPGVILINDTHSVSRDGDRLLYKTGRRVLMTIVRSRDRVVFFTSPEQGFYVDLPPGRIVIHRDGKTTEYAYTTD